MRKSIDIRSDLWDMEIFAEFDAAQMCLLVVMLLMSDDHGVISESLDAIAEAGHADMELVERTVVEMRRLGVLDPESNELKFAELYELIRYEGTLQ